MFYLLTTIKFHTYVGSIYPNELEIKDTKECSTYASYLDILLKFDTYGKLTTQLYDKRDYFNFYIVNFLSYVAIFQFPCIWCLYLAAD
jgi:hypothetical protein